MWCKLLLSHYWLFLAAMSTLLNKKMHPKLQKVLGQMIWMCSHIVEGLIYNSVLCYLLSKRRVCFCSIGLSVSLFVFVCGQHYSKIYEWIGMKFYGGVLGSTMKNWLKFGGDLGLPRWVNERKHHNSYSYSYSQIMVQVMIQNLWVSLSPPRLNIFTVGNMGVMICLSKGGLRSQSSSSIVIIA